MKRHPRIDSRVHVDGGELDVADLCRLDVLSDSLDSGILSTRDISGKNASFSEAFWSRDFMMTAQRRRDASNCDNAMSRSIPSTYFINYLLYDSALYILLDKYHPTLNSAQQ